MIQLIGRVMVLVGALLSAGTECQARVGWAAIPRAIAPSTYAAGPDPAEPNDDFATALPVACPSFVSNEAAIAPKGDLDYYLLTGEPFAPVTVDIDAEDLGSLLDSVVGAFDSAFVLKAMNDDGQAPGETSSVDSYLQFFLPADGVIYIVVTSWDDLDFDGAGDFIGTGDYTLTLSCGTPPPPVEPGELLAATSIEPQALLAIDPSSGAPAVRGPLGQLGTISDIEFLDDGTLIASAGVVSNRLVDVFPRTGEETDRCDVVSDLIGGQLAGLEHVDGILMASHSQFPGAPSDLAVVGEPDAGGQCALTLIGATGFGPLGGLARNPSTGILHACGEGTPGAGDLLTCDPATGACTVVGPTGFPSCSALEFDRGTLYAAVGPGNPQAGTLLVVDPATGAATAIASTASGGLNGLAWVPGGACPLPPALCDTPASPCSVEPGAVSQDAVLLFNSPGVGFVTHVLGVEIEHNGHVLRTTAGPGESSRLVASLSHLGQLVVDPTGGPQSFIDTVYLLDAGEVVGYLAITEGVCDGVAGSLGQARGVAEPETLPAAVP